MADVGEDIKKLLDKYSTAAIPYAAVKGSVTAIDDTVESSTGTKGVIQITTLHEVTTKRFGDYWDVDKIPPHNETRKSVPFALRPIMKSTSEIQVTVMNPFNSIWESLLLPSSSFFTPANSSIDSTVMGGIGMPKVMGVYKSEKILPIGTVVTGIGRIVKDGQTGTLKLQEPLEGAGFPYVLTTMSLDDFISRLEVRRNLQRVIIGMTLSLGVLLMYRRIHGWWKRYKLAALRNDLLRERRNVNLDDLCRCQTCLVCLVNPREVIILQCGHVCVCADCILKLNGLCPVCREPISGSHKAYIV